VKSNKFWTHFYGFITSIGLLLSLSSIFTKSGQDPNKVQGIEKAIIYLIDFIHDNIEWLVVITLLFATTTIINWQFRKVLEKSEKDKKDLEENFKTQLTEIKSMGERREEDLKNNFNIEIKRLKEQYKENEDDLRMEIKKIESRAQKEKEDFINQIKASQPKKVALFVPRSNRSGYFWEQFEIEAMCCLSDEQFYCRLSSLNGDYNVPSQEKKISEYNWDEIQGAIIAPAGPGVLPHIVERLNLGYPIVLHDITPETWKEHFINLEAAAPKYVTVNNRFGGELAAEIMKKYLDNFRKPKNKKQYNIIYIPGNKNHFHSQQRVSGFKSKWQEMTGGITNPIQTNDGDWIAIGSHNSLRNFLKANLLELGWDRVDGIFACNDEMAIAAIRLLDSPEIREEINPATIENTIVVGFDAIPLAVSELRNKKSRLIATIDAQISQQAKWVAHFLSERIKSPQNINKGETHKIIEPEILKNDLFNMED